MYTFKINTPFDVDRVVVIFQSEKRLVVNPENGDIPTTHSV